MPIAHNPESGISLPPTMNAHVTARRIIAAVAGMLFLVVGVLILIGFGGLGQYSFGVRFLMALLVLAYGVMRIIAAFKSGQREP
jgi:uncharacterized membrane protein HdeD (DUF308 family)